MSFGRHGLPQISGYHRAIELTIIFHDTTIQACQTLTAQDEIEIAEGATLRVEAGAPIVNARIQVNGSLEIAGSADNRVKITDSSISFSDDHATHGRVEINFAEWSGGSFLPSGSSYYESYALSDSIFDICNSLISIRHEIA